MRSEFGAWAVGGGAVRWCAGIHDWRAIHGGPDGYLVPDNEGNFQVCARCGRRRYSRLRHVQAVVALQARMVLVESGGEAAVEQLAPDRARKWFEALDLLGHTFGGSGEDIDVLVARLEPHMLAIDAELAEWAKRVPSG